MSRDALSVQYGSASVRVPLPWMPNAPAYTRSSKPALKTARCTTHGTAHIIRHCLHLWSLEPHAHDNPDARHRHSQCNPRHAHAAQRSPRTCTPRNLKCNAWAAQCNTHGTTHLNKPWRSLCCRRFALLFCTVRPTVREVACADASDCTPATCELLHSVWEPQGGATLAAARSHKCAYGPTAAAQRNRPPWCSCNAP